MVKYEAIKVVRRSGEERLHNSREELEFDLLDFWRRAGSDLVSNVTRGVLAEYLVGRALGVDRHGSREEWAAYVLTAPDGTRVEVKSSAYLQTWCQDRPSDIAFRIPRTKAWDANVSRFREELKRQADVYVFAILSHKDQATLDPMDLSQWEFYVVATSVLNSRQHSQTLITLPSLRRLVGKPLSYAELKQAVKSEGAHQRHMVDSCLQQVSADGSEMTIQDGEIQRGDE